jgi:hypothetical protein
MKTRKHFNLFNKLARLMLTGKTKTIASIPLANKRIDYSIFNFRQNREHGTLHSMGFKLISSDETIDFGIK